MTKAKLAATHYIASFLTTIMLIATQLLCSLLQTTNKGKARSRQRHAPRTNPILQYPLSQSP